MINDEAGACSVCERCTWAASEIGANCLMLQPDGSKCPGVFVKYKPAPPAPSEPKPMEWWVPDGYLFADKHSCEKTFVERPVHVVKFSAYAQVVDELARMNKECISRFLHEQRVAELERELALENQKRNEAVEGASKLERDNLLALSMAEKFANERDEAIIEGRRFAKEAISSREIVFQARIADLERERDAAKSGYTLLYDVKESLRADCDRLRAALEKIANHSPESTDKVVLLINIDGYRDCAREALEGTKE